MNYKLTNGRNSISGSDQRPRPDPDGGRHGNPRFQEAQATAGAGIHRGGLTGTPHMPLTMSVVDKTNIQTWADIGVVFLLFSLGLDFSFKKILKMGAPPSSPLSGHRVQHDDAGHQRRPRLRLGRMDCIFWAVYSP